MFASPKVKLCVTCLYPIVAFLGALALAEGKRGGGAGEPEWYVRAIEGDSSTHAVLRDAGINWIEFEFRLPPDTRAVFTFVATGKNGELIKPLSKVNEVVPLRGENRGRLRLTYINPARLTDNPNGRVRWVKTVGLVRWGGESMEDHYLTSGPGSAWEAGESVEDPQPDVDYDLWELSAYPKGLQRIEEDSPTSFKFEIKFRHEKIGPNDRRGRNSEKEFVTPGKE